MPSVSQVATNSPSTLNNVQQVFQLLFIIQGFYLKVENDHLP